MNKINFLEVPLGSTVFSPRHGTGKIVKILESPYFPIEVEFTEKTATYSGMGKEYFGEGVSLMLTEYVKLDSKSKTRMLEANEIHGVLKDCYHALYELKDLVTCAEENLKYRKLIFRINEQLNTIEAEL